MGEHTERTMLDLLQDRYSDTSQGVSVRYVVAEHVRSHAGFDARRTADFMALDLWPSSGLQLHGFEVKISRSDWLRELKDPSKSEEFKRHCDRWWLVISDKSFVKPGELPTDWGMLAPSGEGLRVIHRAPKLAPSETLHRSFVAAFARSVAKTNHVGMTEMEHAPYRRRIRALEQERDSLLNALIRVNRECDEMRKVAHS